MVGQIGLRNLVIACATVAAVLAPDCAAREDVAKPSAMEEYRGLLGAKNAKIKREGDKTLLWAGGGKPNTPDARWYDFTDAEIPAEDLQFGIGKDRIKSIDDPLFVSPDDPRLLKLGHSPYRADEKAGSTNDLRVIGYVSDNEARAYPVGLLDYHELVNDSIAGKPVTVGW